MNTRLELICGLEDNKIVVIGDDGTILGPYNTDEDAQEGMIYLQGMEIGSTAIQVIGHTSANII